MDFIESNTINFLEGEIPTLKALTFAKSYIVWLKEKNLIKISDDRL